jgi:hypothetical protein
MMRLLKAVPNRKSVSVRDVHDWGFHCPRREIEDVQIAAQITGGKRFVANNLDPKGQAVNTGSTGYRRRD